MQWQPQLKRVRLENKVTYIEKRSPSKPYEELRGTCVSTLSKRDQVASLGEIMRGP